MGTTPIKPLVIISVMLNNKTIVAIFAHPDDEAFGPAGTLAKFAETNTVYLLCATKGHAGTNSSRDQKNKLFKIRERELLQSAKKLGIKKVFFLGFRDGCLCNNQYHRLAEKIKKITDTLKPEMLITFDKNGVSGHIDHITITMVSTYIFYQTNYIKELWYYCLNKTVSDHMRPSYFIYVPEGYEKRHVDVVINVSTVWEKKMKALFQHESQKKDIDAEIALIEKLKLPKEEYFIIKKK